MLGGAAAGAAVNKWQWNYTPGSRGIPDGVCFVPGTLIATPDGPKPIETLQPGDLVTSTNPDTGHTTSQPVTQTYTRQSDTLIRLTIDGHDTLVTPEHPYWVINTGWVHAKNLKPGDQLLTPTGTTVPIQATAVETLDTPTTVHNLQIHHYHTYHAGHTPVLVHNANYGPLTADQLAAKVHLRSDSLLIQNRAMTVAAYVSRFRLGSVRQRLDSSVLNMTVEEALLLNNSTIRKLLTDGRFARR
jgi:hypothetical protein